MAMFLSSVVGKYFSIENKAAKTSLNVKEGLTAPGTPVCMWKEHKGDNQIWYFDPLTDTLRSRQSNLCLDLDATDGLVINPYDRDDPNQKWRYNNKKDVIENVVNPVRVLEVPGGEKHSGAAVAASEYHGGSSQKWKLEGLPIQYFTISSPECDKVLDIAGAKSSAGAKVILWDQKAKAADNQLWFEDYTGNIRSKLSSKLVLDGNGPCVVTAEYKEEKTRNYWVISGKKILHKENMNEVIGIRDHMLVDGAELKVYPYRGEPHHHWDFNYV